MKKIISSIIILFWLIMMGILIKREDLLSDFFLSPKTISYKNIIPKELLLRNDWFGIYFNDKKVGYSNTYLAIKAESKGGGYLLRNNTFIILPSYGMLNRIYFDIVADISSSYDLEKFNVFFRSGDYTTKIDGLRKINNTFILTLHQEGKEYKKLLKLPSKSVLSSYLMPFDFLGKIKKGEKFKLLCLNPLTLNPEQVNITIEDEKIIYKDNEKEKIFIVKSKYKGIESKIWVTADGKILKEESPLGWKVVKESQAQATELLKESILQQTDILTQVSIPSNISLPPEHITTLKIKIFLPDGYKFKLSDYRQKILETNPEGEFVLQIKKKLPHQNKIVKLPQTFTEYKDFLKSSVFIQADEPKIKNLAQRIVKNGTNSYEVSKKIMEWIYKNISKIPTVSVPSAMDVLKKGRGDCNELTYLFVAMARACGIPSKIISGLIYAKERFYYHTWPRVFVGEWVDMDPTYGQEVVDATYIKLAEGELNEQLKLAGLINKLKIEILEWK